MSNVKRSIYDMPNYMLRLLKENNLLDIYNARPDYQKNDYIGWITRAKLDTTKQKRFS